MQCLCRRQGNVGEDRVGYPCQCVTSPYFLLSSTGHGGRTGPTPEVRRETTVLRVGAGRGQEWRPRQPGHRRVECVECPARYLREHRHREGRRVLGQDRDGYRTRVGGIWGTRTECVARFLWSRRQAVDSRTPTLSPALSGSFHSPPSPCPRRAPVSRYLVLGSLGVRVPTRRVSTFSVSLWRILGGRPSHPFDSEFVPSRRGSRVSLPGSVRFNDGDPKATTLVET